MFAGEHCRDVGRVGLDVRRHHQDVVWLEFRVGIEQRQQLVVQYLHFPHWTVAGVNL
jgi:hypothetical protein